MWTVKLAGQASPAADVVDEINCNFGDDDSTLWIHYRMLDGQPTVNTVQYGATAAYGMTATAIAPASFRWIARGLPRGEVDRPQPG